MTRARKPAHLKSLPPSPLAAMLSRVDAVADGATAPDAIPTGFPSLDRVLGGGLRAGDLTLLGGDVASGKSALALAIALRTAQAGHSVLFLSGEMTPERVLERAVAIEGRVRVDDLRLGNLDDSARARVGAAVVRLRDAQPEIERLPLEGPASIAARLGQVGRPRLVIVDSIQAFSKGSLSTEEGVAATVRELKALALDAHVAILATSQLPFLAPRSDRRPQLDDFGGLGAVKGLADLVLALYRESMYDAARDVEGATELLVRKNRNGGTGYVDLYFYSQWMRFEDMLDPDR